MMSTKEKQELKETVMSMPFPELELRQTTIQNRLQIISIDDPFASVRAKKKKALSAPSSLSLESTTIKSSSNAIPYTPKSDAHWDFVMKEMQWLSVDFQGERKRQISLARKQAGSIKQYHATKEKRRLKAFAEMEMKKRRLASKLARDVVKGWWNAKIERVIAYKQKVDADLIRKRGMDRHLVFLVKQTERYTDLLNEQLLNDNDGDGNADADASISRRTTSLTIEQALNQTNEMFQPRSTRQRHTDYQILANELRNNEEVEFYGESTEDEDSEMEEFVNFSDEDDETTLIEAEEIDSSKSILKEADLLVEESQMDLEDVLKRFEMERDYIINGNGGSISDNQTDMDVDATDSGAGQSLSQTRSRRKKRVKFASDVSETTIPSRPNAKQDADASLNDNDGNDGNDADDDADMSDVDDFASQTSSVCSDDQLDVGGSDDDDEFTSSQMDCIDDETTLEAEMRLKPEISPEDEIALLQREAEMSVDELRAMYANAVGEGDTNENAKDTETNQDEVKDDEGIDQVINDDDESMVSASSGGSEAFENDHEAIDDETTIEAEERLGREMSYEDEIALLEKENEMSVEELRAKYLPIDEVDENTTEASNKSDEVEKIEEEDPFEADDQAEQDEFRPSGEGEVDDETTIEAEERLGREMSYEDEIALLEKENEMSVEELRAKYLPMDKMEENAVEASESQGCESENTKEEDPFEADDQAEQDEFRPSGEGEVDDETTIEAEERLGREMSYEDEISLLQKENEMSIEELRALYLNQDNPSDEEENLSDDEGIHSDSQDETDFQPIFGADVDDETTIEAEERLGREMSYEDEISMLEKENEMSVDELRAMYLGEHEESPPTENDEAQNDSEQENESCVSKKRKLSEEESEEEEQEEEDAGAEAIRSLEYADAKARNTAVSRPYLISSWVKLRAYQQIGLNWLVSIQTRRLNGILADEMGLGKTLQTISLLSYLASYKGIWGPHLIIVPTSCIVNWEVELKRFCPALKVLCYYGSAKRRKELRQGWTKTNWHHVVITSYQLAVQDAFAFKRKKWYYLVLDEAHNIKNFQSQRWQTLVNFNTQRRLLLTGTPLQNNLMELWSLLHFLMPHVFRSRKEFSYWFSNPMNNIIEGNSSRNDDLISRLHGIIRPFVLRRLKKDVETQMPGKYEHIVKCHLSRRQMFLYEEFMARSSTRMALQNGGNYMGMMNVLMQLRKVCNHPDLFEPRSVITPFCTERISLVTAAAVVDAIASEHPLHCISSKLIHPLWSVGSGEPSFDGAKKQSEYVTSRRRKLKVDTQTLKDRVGGELPDTQMFGDEVRPGLRRLLQKMQSESKSERQHTAKFNAALNEERCDAQPFMFSEQLLDAASVDIFSLKTSASPDFTSIEISSTPMQLLSMRQNQERERARDSADFEKNFIFYVPRAGSQKPMLYPKSRSELDENSISLVSSNGDGGLQNQDTSALFFPDKKLVQFDAGKLQILAELLRNLKHGKHRVLIFTQMSKMLDILEAFLNLNGHTYLRLDGGTSVDQRQRLMDRFNNDEKVFCFILSTRSGGLGINLTGADTVVFYDSDWNPAMDAQAQDRAHRIGQTRDVHIYRLVTEHSIEENILVKAKQKRHLDFLVMDEGKFHAAPEDSTGTSQMPNENEENDAANFDITSKGGLRNILGVASQEKSEMNDEAASDADKSDPEVSKEQVESAMANLEDEDDVLAMRGAEQEAKDELQEFDENVKINEKDEDGNDSQDSQDENAATKKENKKEDEKQKDTSEEDQAAALEREFAAWQSQVGVDKASIDASLNPVERYALRFKEDVDPFYSMWYLNEQQRIQESEASQEEWDIAEIEAMKAEEERNAIENGDLLATLPDTADLQRQRYLYFREKARLVANKKRRRLTGENWRTEIDGKTKLPFWYNSDTGEATWHTPQILLELKEYELAGKFNWNAMPLKPLVRIMEFLVPYPDRMKCAVACKHWRKAAQDISFVRHVYPVEMGALSMDPKKMHPYHYRTISEALQNALPGDTIELGDGHYWINEPELVIKIPLRLIGDEKDPTHVVIELSGNIAWKGCSGFMEGITFRRPRMGECTNGQEMLKIEGGHLKFIHGIVEGAKEKATAGLKETTSGCGVIVRGGKLKTEDCVLTNITGCGIDCFDASQIELVQTRFVDNSGSSIQLHDNSTMMTDNCKV